MKKKERIDRKENKWMRVVMAIASLKEGETVKPTPFAKKTCNVSKGVLTDFMDAYESISQLGFVILRDKNEQQVGYLKLKDNSDTRSEIIELKSEIIELKKIILESDKKRRTKN